MVLEACVENIEEAIKAQELGANRIELCDNLSQGGTTPSAGTITIAKSILKIPIVVIIRPRSGNFVYSSTEKEVMKKDIEFCKSVGVDGIVTGALNENDEIDIDTMRDFVHIAKPLKITFHKAIDESRDIIQEFLKLHEIGVDRILTSGGKNTALEGAENLNKMVNLSKGNIKILAAGNITYSNLSSHQEVINTDEFHGKHIVGNLSVRSS